MPLRRPFSVSTVRKDSAGSSSFNEFSFDATTLSQDEREFYESLSPSDRAEFEEVALSDEQMEQMLKRASAVQSEVEEGLARELGPIDARIRALDTDTGPDREPRVPQGFFNMSEDEDLGPDDEEDGDISSLGHSELEKHRELREYARRIAWEMPLLSSEYNVSLLSLVSRSLYGMHRTCPAIRTPLAVTFPPLPLHHLHGRGAPCSIQSRPRVQPGRHTLHDARPARQAHQAGRPALQSRHRVRQDVRRIVPHSSAEQAVSARPGVDAAARGPRSDRHLRGRPVRLQAPQGQALARVPEGVVDDG